MKGRKNDRENERKQYRVSETDRYRVDRERNKVNERRYKVNKRERYK